MPDGMGADRYNERQNMRAAREEPGFTHDVVAVDESGEVLFETESLYPNEVDDALTRGAGYPEGDDAPEGVDHYEVRER